MVKCANCGYLASRNNESRILEETEQITRDEGIPSNNHEPPICFVQAKGLWNEGGVKYGIVTSETVPNIQSTVQKERDCGEFTTWHQGFVPREHREMLDRQWQLEQEEKRRKSDRIWHFVELGITLIVGAIIALVSAHISNR